IKITPPSGICECQLPPEGAEKTLQRERKILQRERKIPSRGSEKYSRGSIARLLARFFASSE
ncbi:MAG: hypothetical protein RR239_01750, partial [Oscillospiraceae bacterium]